MVHNCVKNLFTPTLDKEPKKKRDDRSRLVKSLTFWGHLNIQIDLGLFYVHIISVFQGYYPTFIHTQMEQNLLTL